MAMLTVEGFEVPILPGTQLGDAKHGDIARAYSGKLRTDHLASHRVGHIAASIFDTTNDAPALRAILNSPGPVLLGGTLIGDDAYFHVSNLVVGPVTGTTLKFDFDVAETDDSPSALLFSFDGDAPGTYTFTRSGAVGKAVDSAGVLQDFAANIFRRPWTYTGSPVNGTLPDTQTGLVEAARTNLVTSDDLTAWTTGGTPVVTGSVSDPAGGTGAYTVEDDDGAVQEDVRRTISFTGDAVKAVVVVVRENTAPAGDQRIQVTQTSGTPADRLNLLIGSWVGGEPQVTASTGTYLGTRYVGNGYWAIYSQTTSVTATETNLLVITPAVTVAQTGSIDVYRVNAYDAILPLWSIVDASEVKAVDTWYADFTAVPQAMTIYVKFVEGMQPTSGNWDAADRVMAIGNAADTGARLFLYRATGSGDVYTIRHINSDGTADDSSVDISPTWGDTIELCARIAADGSVDIIGSNGGAAEVASTPSGAVALSAAWADTRLYLASVGVGSTAMQATIEAKVVSGVRTMAEMRDWARGRLWPRQT